MHSLGVRAPGTARRAQVSRRLSLGRVNTLLAVLSRPARTVNHVATAPSSSGGGAPTCLARARRVGMSVRRGLVCRCRRRSATARVLSSPLAVVTACSGPAGVIVPWFRVRVSGACLHSRPPFRKSSWGLPHSFLRRRAFWRLKELGQLPNPRAPLPSPPACRGLEGTHGLRQEPCPAPPGTGGNLRHPCRRGSRGPTGRAASSPRDWRTKDRLVRRAQCRALELYPRTRGAQPRCGPLHLAMAPPPLLRHGQQPPSSPTHLVGTKPRLCPLVGATALPSDHTVEVAEQKP